MKKEREDWITPEAPPPNRLTLGELKAVYKELKRGASVYRLAEYFNTTTAEIETARQIGELSKW